MAHSQKKIILDKDFKNNCPKDAQRTKGQCGKAKNKRNINKEKT